MRSAATLKFRPHPESLIFRTGGQPIPYPNRPNAMLMDLVDTVDIEMVQQAWQFSDSKFTGSGRDVDREFGVMWINYSRAVGPALNRATTDLMMHGYRCVVCRKVFFALNLDGYIHECMKHWEARTGTQ